MLKVRSSLCSGDVLLSRWLSFVFASRLAALVGSTCQLPVSLPPSAHPAGATVGPQNSLVLVSKSGSICFVDLNDYAAREDTALPDKYADSYGVLNLQGVAMTEPDSSFLYLVAQDKAMVLEYEWQSSRQIQRQFNLPGFTDSNMGVKSLTWVPTEASRHNGFFYVGAQMTGQVYIFEVPLYDETGPEAVGKLMDIWTPLKTGRDVASLSGSGGYIFVNYDDGASNHVLLYRVMPTGLPGELVEQYEVDVNGAQGMAVRQTTDDSWEVIFSSETMSCLFAYSFKLVSGFELHQHCGADSNDKDMDSSSSRPSMLLICYLVGLFLCGLHSSSLH